MLKTIKAPFTRELHSFLKQEGYTYIHCKGLDYAVQDNNEYILIPLRIYDLNNIVNRESEMIEPIDAKEITELLHEEDFVRFVVELPLNEFGKYIRTAK